MALTGWPLEWMLAFWPFEALGALPWLAFSVPAIEFGLSVVDDGSADGTALEVFEWFELFADEPLGVVEGVAGEVPPVLLDGVECPVTVGRAASY